MTQSLVESIIEQNSFVAGQEESLAQESSIVMPIKVVIDEEEDINSESFVEFGASESESDIVR